MINHSNCSHDATSSARAKCRRAIKSGKSPVPPQNSDSEFRGSGNAKSKTPRDRDMQCDICGVERIEYRGTEMLTGLVYSVGEKCFYYIKDSEDLTILNP